ncbi:LAME_0H15434g1_1 [Lachancea meyersii CBS 8951]|uniref:LAME_0H15434g1_1 n=1 Tax=Lachancea meyersii CBS 8951 TaxID=1266667 RepID=A0A1G4KHM5_9SACH|nr:LAME_0H15434g1_1 [Lachancea meyersii CBS 8951]
MDAVQLLGYGYVIPWSISAYPPIYNNWRRNSAAATSLDFVMLNIVGYFYLLTSLWLQLYKWQIESKAVGELPRPKVTSFDFWYCLHGFAMNLVVLSQILMGITLWKFNQTGSTRMKPIYAKILTTSVAVCLLSAIQLLWQQTQHGWQNLDTLAFCNKLYLLKISMSVLKYVPQIRHNFERKSMKGFPIQSVGCDVLGSVCSLCQLVIQIQRDEPVLTLEVVGANFGRVGIALVTLLFNLIYISQWLVYRK